MLSLGMGMGSAVSRSSAIRAKQPTINLDFLTQRYAMNLVNKAFGEIINFSRASAATRINAAGQRETVAANVPRIDYDPVTLVCRGLLIEEQRTNFLPSSNAPLVTFYQATGSGGTYTLTNGYVSYVRGAATIGAVVGQTFAVSFDISGTPGAQLGCGLTQLPSYASVTQLITLSEQKRRMSAVVTINNASTTGVQIYFSSPQSAVTFSIENVQVELGGFATSYIPTAGSQATRAGDVVSINTLSPWFSAGNGVLYTEHTTFNPAPAANRVLELSNGGSQERIYIAQQSATTMRLNSSAAGATVVELTQASPGVGEVTKTASRIKTNDFGISTNGLDAITDADAPAPAGLNVIRLGSANFDLAFLNGHIRKMRYYPKGASNAELKSLTA